jgi:hypothetical protein
MKSKSDFVRRLHEDKKYQAALKSARTDAERQRIATMVESFVGSYGEILGPLIERAKKDPAFAQQLSRALIDGQRVVTSEPVTSGSTDKHG